jgi:hypothetical protein
MVRLATFIAGKTVSVESSVMMHAILSDGIVSQVAQGTTSIYAEVFVFTNLWYINKCMGEALSLIFVFDGDLGRIDHCPTCASNAKSRLRRKTLLLERSERPRDSSQPNASKRSWLPPTRPSTMVFALTGNSWRRSGKSWTSSPRKHIATASPCVPPCFSGSSNTTTTCVGTLMESAGRQLEKTARTRTLHVRPMRRSGAATITT